MVYSEFGERPGMRLGSAVVLLGDTDGDGYSEFAVGEEVAGGWDGRVRVFSGRDGSLRYELSGPSRSRFGSQVASAGDANMDGFADFVVSAPDQAVVVPGDGAVTLYSGRDGSVLWTVGGPLPYEGFGISIAGGADVDGDGRDDVAVGAPLGDTGGVDSGSVFVYSGASGALLARHDGGVAGDMFGWRVALTADMNGDAFGEVVGSGLQQFAGARGYVRVHAGDSGVELHRWSGDAFNDQCGWSLAAAGDVDGDGRADVVAGCHDHNEPGAVWTGMVRVWSGGSGAVLHSIPGAAASRRLGRAVAGVGDVDGDGCDEFAAGTLYAGIVKVFSGRTGALVFEMDEFFNFGSVLGVGGADVNGDGVPELIAGAPSHAGNGAGAGAAFVVSTRDLALTSSGRSISLASGGFLSFELDAGPAHAGRSYLLLGSLSGVRPGIPLGGAVHLPLNFDGYTSVTASAPNLPPLGNSSAVLDAAGQATAFFALPAGSDPGMAGLVLDHAFLLLPQPGGWFDFASNPVPMRLVP